MPPMVLGKVLANSGRAPRTSRDLILRICRKSGQVARPQKHRSRPVQPALMRDNVYYVKLNLWHNRRKPARGRAPRHGEPERQAVSGLRAPVHPPECTHVQSRYQDHHRFRRPALSQQNAWLTIHRRWRFWRSDHVLLLVRQTPSTQSAEIPTFARQGAVCLLAQLQRSRDRRSQILS